MFLSHIDVSLSLPAAGHFMKMDHVFMLTSFSHPSVPCELSGMEVLPFSELLAPPFPPLSLSPSNPQLSSFQVS